MNDSSASRWAAAAAEAAKRVSKVRSKLDDVTVSENSNGGGGGPAHMRKTTTIQHAYEQGRAAQQTSSMEASLQQGLAELDAVRSFLRDGINRCNSSFMQQQQQQPAPVSSMGGGAAAGAAQHHHHQSISSSSTVVGGDSATLQATLQKGLSELEEVRHKLLTSLASATRENNNNSAAKVLSAMPLGAMRKRTTTTLNNSSSNNNGDNNVDSEQPAAANNNNAAGSPRNLFSGVNARPGSAPAARRSAPSCVNPNSAATGAADANDMSTGSANVTTAAGLGGSSWNDRLLQRAQQRRMSRHRAAVETAAPAVSTQQTTSEPDAPPVLNASSFRRRPTANVQVPSRLSSNNSFQQQRLNSGQQKSNSGKNIGEEDEPIIDDDDDDDGDDGGANELDHIIASAARTKGKQQQQARPVGGVRTKSSSSFSSAAGAPPPAPPVRPASAASPRGVGASTAASTTATATTVPLSNFQPKFATTVPTPPHHESGGNNNNGSGSLNNSTSGSTNNNNNNNIGSRPFGPSGHTNQFRPASAGIRSALRRPGSALNSNNSNPRSSSSSSSSYFPTAGGGGADFRDGASTPTKFSATSNNTNAGGFGVKKGAAAGSGAISSAASQQQQQQQQPAPQPAPQQKAMCSEAQALREQGNVQFQAKRYAEAVETYGRALQYEPQSETLLCNRAAANLMLHRFADALKDSQRAAEIEPTLTKAQWRAAKAALFMNQVDTARHHYSVAQRQAFSQADADAIATELKMVDVADRCRRSLRQKDYAEALRAAEALLQVFPPSSPCASVWMCLKVEALLPTDANEALAVAVTTTETDPLCAEGWLCRARGTFYTGHDAASTSASLGFLAKAKEMDRSCGARAITLQAAIETFAKLRDDGNGAYTSGRWLDAHNAYSKCLTIDPNNVSLRAIILCNRAAVSIQRNMWTEALEDIDQSVRLNPTNAKAFTRRARVHQHFNRHDAAIRDLQTAVTIFPSPENQERLQQALEAKQQQQQQQQSTQNNYNNNNNNNAQQERPSSGFYSRPGSAMGGARPSSAQPRRAPTASGGAPGSSDSKAASANQGFRFFAFGASGGGVPNAGSRPGSASGFRRPQSAGGNFQQQQQQQQQQQAPAFVAPRGPCMYMLLGVSRTCDEKTIIKAYRDAALKWHPDKWNIAAEEEKKVAEEKFKDIANAYNTLRDPVKRRQYDAGGTVS